MCRSIDTSAPVAKAKPESTTTGEKAALPSQATVNASCPGEAMPSFLFRYFFHRDANIAKLNTNHDPTHIHKTLGILAVCSFFYRYGYVYPRQGNLGFDGTDLDWFTIAVHSILALSAIQFKVPKKRINRKPMVIYEEYRQHAIVFTLRCTFVFTAVTVFPNAPSYVPALVVMACHLMADRITSIHGKEGNTAVRATSDHMKLSNFYRGVSKFYSIYQFLAITSHILPNARHADLGYNAIIAIQSSAFLMTLYRKRIIRGTAHLAIYGFCLIVSTFHICRCIGLVATLLTLGAFVLRINIPRKSIFNNKFFVWSVFLVACNLVTRAGFAQIVSKADATATLANLTLETPLVQGALLAAGLYAFYKAERAVFGKTEEATIAKPKSS